MSTAQSSPQGPGIEKYGSKTDAFIKVMLVFFISLLSFSVGTYVGKKFSDKEHKLAQLEPKSQNTEVAHGDHGDDKSHESETHAAEQVSGSETQTKALSDDEIAKLAEEFVTEDEVQNKLAEIETPKVIEPMEAVVEVPAVVQRPKVQRQKEVGKAVGREVASVNLKEPTKAIHESTKKTVASIAKKTESNVDTVANVGKYTVQVSSFNNERDAKRLSTELDQKGLSSLVTPAEVKGKQWYRVSVGLFTNESEAKVYLKDLLEKDIVKSAIIQRVTAQR